ncbi:ASCH domain-containing protein [Lentibacillus saliphilus]|uniref:ASCH domain-containing protein n=1 Tax=Lentibacillus saliphilus TaxID=2737028 RepID=UPI001C305115|nr:ASCH domain-containing protein [Lentibacillus saliphilus]
MNDAAQSYWKTFWKSEQPPTHVEAWQFGDDADYLAQLVIDGIKTATCSAHVLYEIEGEALPAVGDYSIILNSVDEPVAIIETTDVTVMPMNEVSEAFAAAEGEGDRTHTYWWTTHERFFTEELEKIGRTFSEDMLLVCERFRLVDVKDQ